MSCGTPTRLLSVVTVQLGVVFVVAILSFAPQRAPPPPPAPAQSVGAIPTTSALPLVRRVTRRVGRFPRPFRSAKPLPAGVGTSIRLDPNLYTPAEVAPMCIDGSPFGFNYRLSSTATNSTRWVIGIPGGGWCTDLEGCVGMAKTTLGSSSEWDPSGTGPGRGTAHGESPYGPECELGDHNCMYLKYCDGSSFTGLRYGTVEQGDKQLHFRGLANFDAAIDWAIAHGLNMATDVVLTGISAGGVAALILADRLGARLSRGCRFRVLLVDSFFIDHPDRTGKPSPFSLRISNALSMWNVTSVPSGALSAECLAANRNNAHLCFMAPAALRFARSSFYFLQSAFDQWQLGNILGLPWSNCLISGNAKGCSFPSNESASAEAFAADLRADLAKAVAGARGQNIGVFVTTCVCHYNCPWGNLTMPQGGATGAALASAWIGNDSNEVNVDRSRGPNGDGSIRLESHGLQPKYARPCVQTESPRHYNAGTFA